MTVTVYSMEGCSQCLLAAQLLGRQGVPYKVVKIDEDFEAADFIMSEGHRSMPQLYCEGKLLVQGGYSGLLKLTDEQFAALK